MAFRAFRFLRDMLDLDETSKTAGNVIAVNDTEDGYELVSPAAAAGGAPSDAKYIVQQANDDLSAEQALGALNTGILKNTTTTGVLSIATEGTDYYKPSGTDVALGDGGTGASTASGARTNLGLVIGTDVPAQSTFADHSARHEDGGADEISLAGLDGTPTALQTHMDDTSAAHAASAISIADSGNDFTATDVEGALAELQSDAETDAQNLTDHLNDATDAHDASAISVLDTAANFTGTNVETVLAELQDNIDAGGGGSVATPPFLGFPGSLSSAALGNTDCYLLKVWVPVDFSVNSIALGIVTSAGNLLLGIYSSAGARLYTSGSFASPGTGARAHTTASTVNLTAGWVYVAIQASDATFATYLGSGGVGVAFSFSNTFGNGLPANLPALSNLVSPVMLTLHPS